jgi:hypothetical protein
MKSRIIAITQGSTTTTLSYPAKSKRPSRQLWEAITFHLTMPTMIPKAQHHPRQIQPASGHGRRCQPGEGSPYSPPREHPTLANISLVSPTIQSCQSQNVSCDHTLATTNPKLKTLLCMDAALKKRAKLNHPTPFRNRVALHARSQAELYPHAQFFYYNHMHDFKTVATAIFSKSTVLNPNQDRHTGEN